MKTYVHKIAAFREVMLERLRANRWKGGWKDESFHYLLGKLMAEVIEVAEAVRCNKSQVTYECADVANIAMMIADISGDLKQKETD